MQYQVSIDHCPYCDGETFGEGRQMAQGNILPTEGFLKGVLGSGTPLYHTICLTCGTIVRSYVKKTKSFE